MVLTMLHVRVHRAQLLDALRQMRPWIRKQRRLPIQSAVRLVGQGDHFQILAGFMSAQARRSVSAEVEAPGTVVVDALALLDFARYTQGEWLSLAATDNFLLGRPLDAPQKFVALRKFPNDSFPDLEQEGLLHVHLDANRTPDRDLARFFQVETHADDLMAWLRWLDYPLAHPAKDLTDLLMVQAAGRDAVDCFAFQSRVVYFFRQRSIGHSGNFEMGLPRRNLLPLVRSLSGKNPQDICRISGYPNHMVVQVPGASDLVVPVLHDYALPEASALHTELKAARKDLRFSATVQSWWDFLGAVEPVVDRFPILDIAVAKDQWTIDMERDDTRFSAVLHPREEQRVKPVILRVHSEDRSGSTAPVPRGGSASPIGLGLSSRHKAPVLDTGASVWPRTQGGAGLGDRSRRRCVTRRGVVHSIGPFGAFLVPAEPSGWWRTGAGTPPKIQFFAFRHVAL
jgi:hypothetical protein